MTLTMKMTRRTKLIGIACCAVLTLVLAFGWVVISVFDAMWGNDTTTQLESKVSMLDGRVQLGLYRQHMWDALLWTVLASPDSLPAKLDARNGTISTKLPIVTGEAQLGFSHPPILLVRVSRTEATICQDTRCRTIRCTEDTLRCE